MADPTRRRLCTAIATLPLICTQNSFANQDTNYPSRPIRMVVPYPGGDGTDVITRLLTKQMSEDLHVPVVVENRTGAAGLVGAQSVAAASPDGYSICLLVSGHITHQTLYKQLDLLGKFAPVTNLATAPFALIVPKDSRYQTIQDLVTDIQKNPGYVTMATGGLGSPAHMAFELLRSNVEGGLNVNHIPYKSGLESTQAVMAQQTDFASSYIGSVLPQVEAGKVRVLAVTSAERIPNLPDVPTINETLVPGWAYNTLLFFAVPRDTPKPIIQKLDNEIRRAGNNKELLAMLDMLAHRLELSPSPEALEDTLKVAIQKETELIAANGITIQK